MTKNTPQKTESLLGATTPSRVILAGWPSESFTQITAFMRSIRPESAATQIQNQPIINPFAERLIVPKDPCDIETLRQELAQSDKAVLLIFLEDLETVLADQLRSGSSGFESADQWHYIADRLLGLAERESSRVKLISADEALHAPASFVEFLSRELLWPLQPASQLPLKSKQKWDDFYLMAATHYIRERPELSRLATDFREKRAFRSVNPPQSADSIAVVNDFEALRRENCVLLELLHKLQMDLEDAVLQRSKRDDSIRDLTRKLTEASEEAAALKRSLKTIRESTSWKLTQPLRTAVVGLRRILR